VAARRALVERYPRNAFTLTDKMPLRLVKSTSDYQKYFDEQLVRCGVEYFDYYLMHDLMRKYQDTTNFGGFDFLKSLKAEGKVKHIGFSYHDRADSLDNVLAEHPEMEYVQLQINYVDWEDADIQARKCYEVASKYGKPVIVMEPVKGGKLATVSEDTEKLFRSYHPDLSPASWAIRFAASHENVFLVLSGMSSMEQVVDNVRTMKEFVPFNKEEWEIIGKATEIVLHEIRIVPCTNCRYCVDGCPQNILIPEYFALYNAVKRFGGLRYIHRYQEIADKTGKASDCIGCRQCEESCPQHIVISEWLKEVAETMEIEVPLLRIS
jgi:predicted aldo/keto reductase-like oxidoreductase